MQASRTTPEAAAPAPARPRAAGAGAGGSADRKRSLRFLKQHELNFALEPVTRDQVTGEVTLALCQFCKHFGREERAGRKRKATANLKFFKKAFRTDQYVQHHASQHASLWARYEQLPDEDKRAFFPASGGREPPRSQLPRPRAPNEVAASEPTLEELRCWFELPAPVLDFVLQLSNGEVEVFAFAPTHDDNRSPSDHWTPAPGAFRAFDRLPSDAKKRSLTATVTRWTPTSVPIHRVVVWSREELDSMVELLAGGLSYHQLAHTMRWLNAHMPALQAPMEAAEEALAANTGLQLRDMVKCKRPRLGTGRGPWRICQLGSEEQALEFVRLAMAGSLQMMSTLLHSSWGFGLEFSAHTCVPKRPFVDVRVRFYSVGEIRSAHLVSLPATERSFQLQLFHTLERMLTAILPAWRKRIVGVSTDGDAKVLARIQDTLALLEQQLPSSARVYRVSSASHELQAILQRFYSSVQGGGFLSMLRLLVTNIRRSPVFLELIGSDPPSTKHRGTTCARWSLKALALEIQWIYAKREILVDGICNKKTLLSSNDADPSWWVFLTIVSHVAVRSLELFDNMATLTTPHDQAPLIKSFAIELIILLGIEDTADCRGNKTNSGSIGHIHAFDEDNLGSINGAGKVFRSRSKRFVIRAATVHDLVQREDSRVLEMVSSVVEQPLIDLAWENLCLCAVNMVESLVELGDLHGGTGTSAGDKPTAPSATESTEYPLPPVTPHALAALSGREFAALVKSHSMQLRESFTEEELDVVDQEHQALRRAATRDTFVKDALARYGVGCDGSAETFAASWAALRGRSRLLQEFAGGLASARPSDSPVMSASVRKNGCCTLEFRPSASDEVRAFAADFGLEGAMHAQQFSALGSLVDASESQEAVI